MASTRLEAPGPAGRVQPRPDMAAKAVATAKRQVGFGVGAEKGAEKGALAAPAHVSPVHVRDRTPGRARGPVRGPVAYGIGVLAARRDSVST